MLRSVLVALLFLIPSVTYAQTTAELSIEVSEYVYFLADGPRSEGSERMQMCQEYIRWLCQSWGYETELQKVGKCYNVLAWKEGTDPGVVVIGAHLDSYAGRPGADDNASGSAAILAMAHQYARVKPKYTMCFQWYTAEERGLVGSRYYTNNPKWPIKDHIFMLNFDMVGRLSKRYKVVPDINVNAIIKLLVPRFSFAKNITYQNGRRSDQSSFANKGIPVVWLFTGTHNDYHKSTDTPDKINYTGLALIVQYGKAIIDEVVPTKLEYILEGLPELNEDH